MPLISYVRAPRCAQCARAARLLTRSLPSSSTSFALASRSSSLAPSAARIPSPTPLSLRRFSQSPHLAAKWKPRTEPDPANDPDPDFNPTIEELLRGPDEEIDESQFDDVDDAHAHGEEEQPPAEPKPKQKTAEISYYSLFPKTLAQGTPPAGPFAIDTRALHREFLQLQAAAHPDFHHAASGGGKNSAANKRRAEALSSLINEAYRTLVSPLQRAQYLLRTLYGIDMVGDEGTLAGGPGEANLLMEVMEVREQIEWAAREEELEPIRAANDERMRESEEVLAAAFAAEDSDTARYEAMRLRYWVNIDEALKNWGEGAATYFDNH